MVNPNPNPTPAPNVAPTATPARRTRFNLPVGPNGAKAPAARTPPTKRARVLGMLTSADGATYDEVSAAIGWDKRTTYEGIVLLNKLLGWGLVEDTESGKIRAFSA